MERIVKMHYINRVIEDSIAQQLGISAGDYLISINNQEIKDIFDYQYLTTDEYIDLYIEHQDGSQVIYEIEKEYDEELGIDFMDGLMDEYHSCKNRCIFCFIHQMPPGMRKSLYFQDDDSRLSFLQGNYITLTNLTSKDVDRLIEYHLEPINISIHTMDKELRKQMLKNPFAGDSLDYLDRFKAAGIRMNGQIVLCKGVNDGKNLEYSLDRLLEYAPELESVSIVPAGLTKYRKNLYPLENYTPQEAREVISLVDKYQRRALQVVGNRFFRCSDEWYLVSQTPIPEASFYEGYGQLENGVGMIRLLEEEFMEALRQRSGDGQVRKVSIATGVLAYPLLKKLTQKAMEKYPKSQIFVYCIQNDFFGEDITVAGLLTGQDIMKQLAGKDLGEKLLLSENMLKFETELFLDDVYVKDIEEELHTKIVMVKSEGEDLLDKILRREE